MISIGCDVGFCSLSFGYRWLLWAIQRALTTLVVRAFKPNEIRLTWLNRETIQEKLLLLKISFEVALWILLSPATMWPLEKLQSAKCAVLWRLSACSLVQGVRQRSFLLFCCAGQNYSLLWLMWRSHECLCWLA